MPSSSSDGSAVIADIQGGEIPILLKDLCTEPFVVKHAGRPLHPNVPHRWVTAGLRGVKLECARFPTGLCTSRAAFFRFVESLNTANRPRKRAPRRAGGKS